MCLQLVTTLIIAEAQISKKLNWKKVSWFVVVQATEMGDQRNLARILVYIKFALGNLIIIFKQLLVPCLMRYVPFCWVLYCYCDD